MLRLVFLGVLLASLLFASCSRPASAPPPVAPPVQQAAQQGTTQQVPGPQFRVLSVTSPVGQGASATLVAQTVAGAQCDIDVIYKSGSSTAAGLYRKTADSNGRVSWTWKVGTRTTPGTWPIVVSASAGGKTTTVNANFTVR